MDTEHHFTMLPVNSRFTFERVEEEEILELLGSLDLNKETALDGISCRMLMMFAPAISRSLTALFNFSLETCQVASEWKLARLRLYLKVAALRKWKIFVRCLCCQWWLSCLNGWFTGSSMHAYLHKHSILNVAQSGF